MLLKGLLWLAIIYFGYKFYQSVSGSLRRPEEKDVRGRGDASNLDLNDADVEDAQFRELGKKDNRNDEGS